MMDKHTDFESSGKNNTYVLSKKTFWCCCITVAVILSVLITVTGFFYAERTPKPPDFRLFNTVSTEDAAREQILLFVNAGITIEVNRIQLWDNTDRYAFDELHYAFYLRDTDIDVANALIADSVVNIEDN